jgi:valyl-tRNA synthetase
MDRLYNHKEIEEKIYELWEKTDAFKAKIDPKKKPFTILIPPPNASGKMHIGNVLMIAIEDILIRYHRMLGDPTLWVPGTDHAGFETQTTYERELKKDGKSRFDYERETLYKNIWDFVQKNKSLVDAQIRRMGASVDWSRYTFTLDPKVVESVCRMFKRMFDDGLIYRGDYVVNYSFKWGTTFSDAEVVYKEQKDPLYFVKYKLKGHKENEPEYLILATVRPETIMVDTHLCVNPRDSRNSKYAGRQVYNPITGAVMEIIEDNFVDPEFGTGIVKLTPAHDKNDYEVALRKNVPIRALIEKDGKLNKNGGKFSGLKIIEAREKVVSFLKKNDLIARVQDDYVHQVPVDYRSGDYIENLILPNWFIRVDDPKKSFKKPAYDAVKNGEIKIYPKWREKTYLRWMESMRDWPISRQIVWGIRIPAWKCDVCGEWRVTDGKIPDRCGCGSSKLTQDTDTFDTWFSSGQWPLVALGYPDSEDFKYFYPTSVIETGWEIVTRWVSRMIMFGYYATGEKPFSYVYLHGIVRAMDGKKMSKSLGNVINPEDYILEFGTDALRMGLVKGTVNGHDFNFPKDKILGYRKFANKVWNIGRFIKLNYPSGELKIDKSKLKKDDEWIVNELEVTIKKVSASLDKFRFADAGDIIYQFIWHSLADKYLEKSKGREESIKILTYVFKESLKLLHPFMPFVTEAIWQELKDSSDSPTLAKASWPK